MRLAQYALLGIGGVRALQALGIDPGVVHLNEGHASLACLELARAAMAEGASQEDAFEAVRRRTVFTTHTPVPAGNDTYAAGQIVDVLSGMATELGVDPEALVRRGRTHPDEAAEPFGVTQFALRSSRRANGVSARHGEVAREMWHDLWPDRAVADVPITHVTNGVHVPTWIGGRSRSCSTATSATGWVERTRRSGDLGGRRRDPRRRAVGRPLRAARRADRARARAQHRRAPRPRRHRRVRAARPRRWIPTC